MILETYLSMPVTTPITATITIRTLKSSVIHKYTRHITSSNITISILDPAIDMNDIPVDVKITLDTQIYGQLLITTNGYFRLSKFYEYPTLVNSETFNYCVDIHLDMIENEPMIYYELDNIQFPITNNTNIINIDTNGYFSFLKIMFNDYTYYRYSIISSNNTHLYTSNYRSSYYKRALNYFVVEDPISIAIRISNICDTSEYLGSIHRITISSKPIIFDIVDGMYVFQVSNIKDVSLLQLERSDDTPVDIRVFQYDTYNRYFPLEYHFNPNELVSTIQEGFLPNDKIVCNNVKKSTLLVNSPHVNVVDVNIYNQIGQTPIKSKIVYTELLSDSVQYTILTPKVNLLGMIVLTCIHNNINLENTVVTLNLDGRIITVTYTPMSFQDYIIIDVNSTSYTYKVCNHNNYNTVFYNAIADVPVEYIADYWSSNKDADIREFYDIDLSLTPSFNMSTPLIYGKQSIIRSLHHLFLMDQFDRPLKPFLDSRIRSMLFSVEGQLLRSILYSYVDNHIKQLEKRVTIQSIEIGEDFSNNKIMVTIMFQINRTSDIIPITLGVSS